MNRLSIKEASHRLGVAEPTVRRRIRRGELEHGKDDDGRIWVCVPELVAVEPRFHDLEGTEDPMAEGAGETAPDAHEPVADQPAPAAAETEMASAASTLPIADELTAGDRLIADALEAKDRLMTEALKAKDQLIAELMAERDRWVAEAASKQTMIQVLIDQGENYQVLLHEAQAAVKRLSAPPPEPRRPVQEIELQRVGSREELADDEDEEYEAPARSSAAPAPAAGRMESAPRGATDPEPSPPSTAVVAQRKWWRW